MMITSINQTLSRRSGAHGLWAALTMLAAESLPAHAAFTGTPAWTMSDTQVGSRYGWAVSAAGDINGDGFSDAIVGAPRYDAGETDEGRVLIYLGSPTGFSTSIAHRIESNEPNALFGLALGAAGDVNADGYGDVIVGAPEYSGGEALEGRAQVFFGSPTGLLVEPAWTMDSNIAGALFGESVSTAGDVNGDGYDDILIGADGVDGFAGAAYLYLGGPTGPARTPAWIGTSGKADSQYGFAVASAGDVNADGYDDVVVGAPYLDSAEDTEGRVYVYHGGPTGLGATPAWTKESNTPAQLFGYSVQTAGDTNGDGYADVVIGAPGYANGETGEGRALLFRGSAAGLEVNPAWSVESDQVEAYLGTSVSTAGDVNGDGFADVVIGASRFENGETDEGAAFLHLGSPGGLDVTPALRVEADHSDALFGATVMTAGDVNGDGFSEFIAGAPYYRKDSFIGLVRVYNGAGEGASPVARLLTFGPSPGSSAGKSVSSAGDLNGDGFGDYVFGMPNYSNGQTGEGAARVVYGFVDDAVNGPLLESDQAFAGFGTSVACAGDVNGDGYDDLIVGAPGYTNGQASEGRAFVYHGTASGVSTAVAWSAEGNKAQASFGWSVSGAGDVNGDGYGDVIVGAYGYTNGQDAEGRAYVYLGSSSGLGSTPWTAESNQAVASFGWSVAGAGDTNNDGFSDVIIGANLYDNGQSNEGRAFVYLGSATGLGSSAAWSAESNQVSANFGGSVASAGDVNGDGFSDVIVGADGFDHDEFDEGRAFVYHGSASGLGTSAAWTIEPNVSFWQLGSAVASAGDVDGDGFSDVVIGAPWASQGELNEGLAFVYHGSSTGLATTPGTSIENDEPSALLGMSVACAGDTNGDGFADVIIGAPEYPVSGSAAGGAFVHLGNKRVVGGSSLTYNTGLFRIARQARAGDDAPIALLGASDYQDAFRIRANGYTAGGRGKVKLEWEVKPRGAAFTGTGLHRSVQAEDTGAPPSAFGSFVELDEVIGGLQDGMAYRWRARILADSPYFPRTPWLSMARNGMSEIDFRAAGPLLDAETPGGMPHVTTSLLAPIHPNPFRAGRGLSFTLPEAGEMHLALYDAQGRERVVLASGGRTQGAHTVAWDGRDLRGELLPPGVYFVRLRFGSHDEAQKMLWIP